MTTDLRRELLHRVSSIRRQGGQAAGPPESFAIRCEMNTDQLHALQSLVGACNDAPFCGADPGCLTLLGRVRHGGAASNAIGRYAVTVRFAYAAPPRQDPGPAGTKSGPAGVGGPRSRGPSGADFGGHLP